MTPRVERMLPLYEAKMVGAYNHRAADVVKSAVAVKRQNQPAYLDEIDLRDPQRLAVPASWVREEIVPREPIVCRLGFPAISSPTNARTLVASILPAVAVGHSIFLVSGADEVGTCLIAAQMNSFALDFVVRQKVAGLNISLFYVTQFPFLPPSTFELLAPWDRHQQLDEWVANRVLAMALTAVDMLPLAKAVDAEIQTWESVKRQRIMTELDAAMFHLFGIPRDDVDYIMDTFPIVKRKDEAVYGSYATKERILAIYDAMQAAIDSGQPYCSPFDAALAMTGGEHA